MDSRGEPIKSNCYKRDNENNGRVKNNLFRAAPRLIKPDAIAAQKPRHAGRAFLKKDERDDCYGKDDLNNCKHNKNNGEL